MLDLPLLYLPPPLSAPCSNGTLGQILLPAADNDTPGADSVTPGAVMLPRGQMVLPLAQIVLPLGQ